METERRVVGVGFIIDMGHLGIRQEMCPGRLKEQFNDQDEVRVARGRMTNIATSREIPARAIDSSAGPALFVTSPTLRDFAVTWRRC
jgi:hypothetical protein